MKVALVHDFLREYGGGERVLETLHEMFPEAPVFTAYYYPKGLGIYRKRFKNWDIRTSWMQKLPLGNRLISPLRVLAPAAFESFDLTDYDLIISSSSTYFSNAVITRPEALHINYIHTPPRYLYGFATSYNYKKHWWTRIAGELANHFLRLWDFQIVQRPDVLVANSENVAKRIKKFYRRDAVVIYPPVDVKAFSSQLASRSGSSAVRQSGDYFLSLGRLVRGKGIEIIVEACTKLDLSLKVVGSGPELKRLKSIAAVPAGRQGKNVDPDQIGVEFLGFVEDEKLPEILAGAKAVIVASEDEDFGIVPVEAMACGTPVIAVKVGGFLETVLQGRTGEFFDKATAESLTDVLKNFDEKKYKPEACRKQAEKFDKEIFKKEILALIDKNFKK